MTLGDKDPEKTNRTILLVGETKTGKSTLVNALVNYAMGVKWEDDVWFEIVENDPERCDLTSQTSDVVMYEIFGFEGETLPYSLTIIDTPGYGDTRGTEQDEIISQRLLDLFRSEDGVHEINVVGLVLKASESRLHDQLRYVFDSAVSLFGKDMENKIVALLTYSDGVTPINALKALQAANVKCAKDKENEPVYFLFNNRRNEDRREDTHYLKRADEITASGMRGLLDFLEKTDPQKLETTVTVLKERIRLTACIQNLQERVQGIEDKQTEIHEIQEALKEHEEEMKRNADFTVKVDEVYKDKESIGGGRWFLVFYEGAVTCTVCEENCHFPGCTMAWYPSDCEVMRRGRCTSCTNKCPVSEHVKEQKIYVTKTREVQKTLQGVKEKYERSRADHDKTTSLLEDLEKQMGTLQEEKDQWLEESFQHVVKLNQIALFVDALSTRGHLDFLIEKMKDRGDTEKVQKLKEIKSQVEERKKAAVQLSMTERAAAGVSSAYKMISGLKLPAESH